MDMNGHNLPLLTLLSVVLSGRNVTRAAEGISGRRLMMAQRKGHLRGARRLSLREYASLAAFRQWRLPRKRRA
jgi:hypothetical protein